MLRYFNGSPILFFNVLYVFSFPSFIPFIPSFLPQAVDRAYRLGQKRNVVVYRFVTCGTLEETIYRKQVFKHSLLRSAIKDQRNVASRYFSKRDLREVFSVERPQHVSVTHYELTKLHPPSDRRTYPELEAHINLLCGQTDPEFRIVGVSDHDLLFTKHEADRTTSQGALKSSQRRSA